MEAKMHKFSLFPAAVLSFIFLIPVCLFAASSAQTQTTYYLFNGHSLETRYGNPNFEPNVSWQVWLYQAGVRIPNYAPGLQYSRWGLIEGTSATAVMRRLQNSQSFEEDYLKFFGSNTWPRYTFLNPLGPIAIAAHPPDIEPVAPPKAAYQLSWLGDRLNKLIATLQPSLENNDGQGPDSPLKEYFDLVRDALVQISRLYNQMARSEPQFAYIEREISQVQPAVAHVEDTLPAITAELPSVKLPTSTTWMSQSQYAGRDGNIQTAITETESGVSVRQAWVGGDGGMTGTVILSDVPYRHIGDIELRPPYTPGDNIWTVRVHAARTPFTQKIDSPERRTVKATLSAVSYTTAETSVYLNFANSADAHDAYAYFLYHKQLGR
jgi:hypothetical protein